MANITNLQRSHGRQYTNGEKIIRLLNGEKIPEGFRPTWKTDKSGETSYEDYKHLWCLYDNKVISFKNVQLRTGKRTEAAKCVILDDRTLDDPTYISPAVINEELLQVYLRSKVDRSKENDELSE